MRVLLSYISQSQDTLIPALQSSGPEAKSLTNHKPLFSKITLLILWFLFKLEEQSTEKG